MNRLRGWCFCLLLCSMVACKVERPDTIISDAKMEKVLYDYHIAKAMGEELLHNDAYKRVLYMESVYKKHGITQAEFDSSMVWYARNPEVLSKIYEKVSERLKAQKEIIDELVAIHDNKPQESIPGDSVDVWFGQRTLQLTGMPLDNHLSFTIPSDSNFQDRDSLCWSVNFRFLKSLPDTASLPIMAMQIEYEKDTLNLLHKVTENGVRTLSLYADTLGKLKEVSGFVYYPMQQSVADALLLDDISLMRYHAKDSLGWVQTEVKQEETPESRRRHPAPSGKELIKRKVDNLKQMDEIRPLE